MSGRNQRGTDGTEQARVMTVAIYSFIRIVFITLWTVIVMIVNKKSRGESL
jgi:hypothetical protein